jgi:DNA-binding transcriptional MerR regulator
MMNDNIHNEQLFRLSTLAEKTGISVHCIRTYVDQRLIQTQARTAGGLLLFSASALVRLRFIKTARDANVPLVQISRFLAANDHGDVKEISTSFVELKQYIQDTQSKVKAFEYSLITFGELYKFNNGATP